MTVRKQIILVDQVEPLILEIRGQKVLLDRDLAELYGVSTKVLNQAVKRNRDRFPDDFMFQLTAEEVLEMRSQTVTASGPKSDALRSQSVTLKTGRGQHRKYLPYAFTEHGAIMAATVLSSPRAVEISLFVVRAFVNLRRVVASHKDLAAKLTELERRVTGHDDSIRQLIAAIRQLMPPPPADRPKRRIGFAAE